jgi:hypothetical protein
MLSFRFRSGHALFWLTLVFASWLIGIATRTLSAAPCNSNGCYSNTCLVWGQLIYQVVNAGNGATCVATYADPTGNNEYCQGSTATTLYPAKGDVTCDAQGNIYGTAPGCTVTDKD